MKKIKSYFPFLPLIIGILGWIYYDEFNLYNLYLFITVHFVLVSLIVAPIIMLYRNYKRTKK